MEQPDFCRGELHACRIVIWGLGLMGGSLASGLKGKCAWVAGLDRDEKVIQYALEKGIIQAGSTRPQDLLENADVIILATPVRTILKILGELPGICPKPMQVIDLGSTKRDILQKMMSLPERFDILGGHPMCGKEKGSIWNSDPSIFHGATIAFTKTNRSSPAIIAIGGQLSQQLGATPLWMEAERHDQWVSVTSHVPYLLSNALVQVAPEEVRPLIGPGFRSTARLSANSTAMMVDILVTNRENILDVLKQVKTCLSEYETLLEQGDFDGLEEILEINANRHRTLVQEGL